MKIVENEQKKNHLNIILKTKFLEIVHNNRLIEPNREESRDFLEIII